MCLTDDIIHCLLDETLVLIAILDHGQNRHFFYNSKTPLIVLFLPEKMFCVLIKSTSPRVGRRFCKSKIDLIPPLKFILFILSKQDILMLMIVFGSIVFYRAIVYKHLNILKVVIHLIIVDKWNRATRLP